MSAVRPTMARNAEVMLKATRRQASRSRAQRLLWMDLDEIQSRAGAGHPDLPDRATAAPYGQDSSIIAQVEVAPPPPEAIASDHRATAGCAPTQFWRFVLTKPQQLPSSHRSHPNKRRGKHPSYGLFSRIHEDRAGSSGFVGNSHEPEVHAGYRDPSPRWLSSDDPRKPSRKSATPSTGRPRLARSRRRGQCQPIGVSILPALPTGRAVAL